MKIEKAQELVARKKPLFTALVYGLKMKEDKKVPTLSTDGNFIYYNKDFYESLTPSEQQGVVLHETLHCALRHLWRRKAFQPMKWNIAADYVINLIVTETFNLPEGTLLDQKYIGMSTKQVYYALPDEKEEQQQWGKDDCNYNEDSEPKEGQSNASKSGDKKGSKRPSPQEEGEVERKWKQLFEENIVKQYGKLPESMKRLVEQQYYVPKINWKDLVSRFLSADTTDYTFAQPDRRFLGGDFVMPEMYSEDTLKDVIFAYDTSGSISAKALKGFLSETKSMMKQFFSLKGWGAVCDADLHWFEPITADSAEAIQYLGGGGTDFNPVFDEVKRRNLRPKALFYFTDTYGSFPDRTPEYPVFWLVPTNIGGPSEISVPFGYVVQFLLDM